MNMRVARSKHNLRFILVCLTLFIGGLVLRYQSAWLTPPGRIETPTRPAEAEPAEQQVQFPPGLRETVLNFYEWVDRGYYREAYQISLENEWEERGTTTYARIGLTSQDDFIAALNKELRPNGTDLSIIEIDLRGAAPLALERRVPAERAELYALDELPPATRVDDVYEVRVGGALIERCSPWEWDKRILVAQLGTGDWKVLLPGIPDDRLTRVQVWFLDQNPFAGLQILEEK